MTDASAAVLSIEEHDVDVAGKARRILVARPIGPVRLGVERLETMRAGEFVSRVDMEILQAVAARTTDLALVVFDANAGDDERSWAFDPALGDDERMELGRHLLRSQVTLYRELIRAGASGLVGVGFGSFALAAFQRGTVRVLTDLAAEHEDAEGQKAAELEVDQWLLEHAATWTGLPCDEWVATRLAEELAARESKRSEIEALLAAASS